MQWIGYGIKGDRGYVTILGDIPRSKAIEVLDEWNLNAAGGLFRLVDLYSDNKKPAEAG